MGEFVEENKCVSFPADGLTSLRIICKNYRIQIYEGAEEELRIRYHNSRFRKVEMSKRGSSLYLEEKMAVRFYGMFRLIELAKDNILEIELPKCRHLFRITAETASTEIDIDSIHAESIVLRSVGGQIQIRDVSIAHSLSAVSETGKIYCQLPGTDADYDIDCRAEYENSQLGMVMPHYVPNHTAPKEIFLRSKTYMPELILTKRTIE